MRTLEALACLFSFPFSLSLYESRDPIPWDNKRSQTSKQGANMYNAAAKQILYALSLLCTQAYSASATKNNRLCQSLQGGSPSVSAFNWINNYGQWPVALMRARRQEKAPWMSFDCFSEKRERHLGAHLTASSPIQARTVSVYRFLHFPNSPLPPNLYPHSTLCSPSQRSSFSLCQPHSWNAFTRWLYIPGPCEVRRTQP